MLISCCALDRASLQRLGSLMQEGSFKGKQLQKLRERCLDCPKPLPSAEMAKLEAASQLPVRNLKVLPDIAKQLCQMRDSFREAVFCVTQEGTDRWMRFLFASQNPFAVFFQDLDVETVEHRLAVEASRRTVSDRSCLGGHRSQQSQRCHAHSVCSRRTVAIS